MKKKEMSEITLLDNKMKELSLYFVLFFQKKKKKKLG